MASGLGIVGCSEVVGHFWSFCVGLVGQLEVLRAWCVWSSQRTRELREYKATGYYYLINPLHICHVFRCYNMSDSCIEYATDIFLLSHP